MVTILIVSIFKNLTYMIVDVSPLVGGWVLILELEVSHLELN